MVQLSSSANIKLDVAVAPLKFIAVLGLNAGSNWLPATFDIKAIIIQCLNYY